MKESYGFKWYTIAEVAKKLQVSRKTMYKLIDREQIKAERKFNRLMISGSTLVEYLTPKSE